MAVKFKTPMKSGHGWVITPWTKLWMVSHTLAIYKYINVPQHITITRRRHTSINYAVQFTAVNNVRSRPAKKHFYLLYFLLPVNETILPLSEIMFPNQTLISLLYLKYHKQILFYERVETTSMDLIIQSTLKISYFSVRIKRGEQ